MDRVAPASRSARTALGSLAVACVATALLAPCVAMTARAADAPTRGVDAPARSMEAPLNERRAKQNFLLHCMGCHGENGDGFRSQVPSMRGPMAALARSDEGRAYLMRVPGVTQTFLDDAEVAEVMNWALREFNGAEAARGVRPFTAAEIHAARARPLLEVAATRERLASAFKPAAASR